MKAKKIIPKKIEDKEIIARILEALDVNAMTFGRKTGIHPNTIYSILRSTVNISPGNIEKIMTTFPTVNVKFLRMGEEPVLAEKSLTDESFNDVFSIPYRLSLIEENQKRIEEKIDQLLKK